MFCDDLLPRNDFWWFLQTLMKKPDERPAARDLFKHPWLQPYMDLFLEKFPQAAAVMPVSENRSRAVLLNQRSSLRRTRFSDQPVSDIIPARAELPPIWQDASNGCAAQADRRESMTLPPITVRL